MYLASVNGTVGPVAEAQIPITDEGLLRGYGAFEVARVYGGVPFAFDEHLERLGKTCAGLRIEVDLERVREETLAVIEEPESLVRNVITRAGNRLVIAEPLPQRPESARVATIGYAPTGVLDGLKTLSYAANILAGQLAKEKGADEALFLSADGRVIEGPTWSFFWVADGKLYTPPLSEGILDSITRRRILEECEATEAICTLADDVANAQEAFIASSVREVLPIVAIDELTFAIGPQTQAADRAFRARVQRELAGQSAAA